MAKVVHKVFHISSSEDVQANLDSFFADLTGRVVRVVNVELDDSILFVALLLDDSSGYPVQPQFKAKIFLRFSGGRRRQSPDAITLIDQVNAFLKDKDANQVDVRYLHYRDETPPVVGGALVFTPRREVEIRIVFFYE